MKLEEAQLKLKCLLEAHQPEEHMWTARAVYLLTALLPILAWPDSSALRGEAGSLLQLDELIRRANIRSGALSDNAWEGVRRYLDWFPGLHMETGSRQIVYSGGVQRESVGENWGYMLMQLR